MPRRQSHKKTFTRTFYETSIVLLKKLILQSKQAITTTYFCISLYDVYSYATSFLSHVSTKQDTSTYIFTRGFYNMLYRSLLHTCFYFKLLMLKYINYQLFKMCGTSCNITQNRVSWLLFSISQAYINGAIYNSELWGYVPSEATFSERFLLSCAWRNLIRTAFS